MASNHDRATDGDRRCSTTEGEHDEHGRWFPTVPWCWGGVWGAACTCPDAPIGKLSDADVDRIADRVVEKLRADEARRRQADIDRLRREYGELDAAKEPR
jgi:hypothetical protein